MNGPLQSIETLRRAQDLFRALCDLAPEDQARGLTEACGSDNELRAAVEALLEADQAEGDALSDRAIDHAEIDTPPETIDGFRVVREIGRGGMGVVYEARQTSPSRAVAIKLIRSRHATRSTRARFAREAEVLALLQHPNIAQVYRSGEFDGDPFIVMELVSGRPLIDAAADLPLRDKLQLIQRIAEAVHHAHQKGVIHRDLKPENILVTDESGSAQPKILDFGIARATDAAAAHTLFETVTGDGTGPLLGTLGYMSPEQLDGGVDVDVRADVYAIGMIAYELLTGSRALDLTGKNLPSAIRSVAEAEPERAGLRTPALRGDIETIIAKAVEKERARRYQSALDLAADISRYLRREPIEARPPSVRYRLGRFASRNIGLVAGLGIGSAAIVAGLILAVTFAAQEHTARTKAEALLYASNLNAAAEALAEHDYSTARRLLEDAPASFRGWEWDHLSSQLITPAERLETGFLGGMSSLVSTGNSLVAFGNREGRYVRMTIDPSVPSIDTAEDFGAVETGTWIHVLDGPRAEPFLLNYASGRWGAPGAIGEGPPRRAMADLRVGEFVSAVRVGQHVFYTDGLTYAAAPVFEHPTYGEVFRPRTGYRGGRIHAIAGASEGPGFGRVLHSVPTASQPRPVSSNANGRVLLERDLSGFVTAYDDSGALLWGPTRLSDAPSSVDVYDPVNHRFVVGFTDGQVIVLDAEDGRVARRMNFGPPAIAGLALLPTEPRLAVIDRAGVLSIARLAPDEQELLRGHTSFVNPLAVSPDGRRIATGAWDRTVKIWDTRTGGLIRTVTVPEAAAVLHLAFSLDGEELAAASYSRLALPPVIHRIDTRSGRIIGSIPTDTMGQTHLSYDDAGALRICSGSAPSEGDGYVAHRIHSLYPAVYRMLTQHPDTLVTIDADFRLNRLDLATGDSELVSEQEWPDARVLVLAPDARSLAITLPSGAIAIIDAESGESIHTLEGHASEVLSVAWSPDTERIATGSRDGSVGIWDASTGTLLARLRGHGDYVYDVAWSPDGSALYSSSGDRTVRIWRD